jgi:hypothetical protein
MKWSERIAQGFSPGFGDAKSALKVAAEVRVVFPTIAISPFFMLFLPATTDY